MGAFISTGLDQPDGIHVVDRRGFLEVTQRRGIAGDGHDISQGAADPASGTVALLEAARVLAAVLLATLFAAPLGLALGQMPRLDRLVSPLIAIIYPIPKIIFLPVIYVLMGISDFSKVTLIAIIIFFQILVVVRDEASSLKKELILSVKSLGAGRRALFRYVYLPASLPAVLTALRVSVGTAVTATFSEPMAAASIDTGSFELRDAGSVLVPATVAYEAATATARLTPSNPLALDATYTARVRGGTSGVTDLAGNQSTRTVLITSDVTPPSVPKIWARGASLGSWLHFGYHSTDAGVGVASYDVRYRTATYTRWYSPYQTPAGWTARTDEAFPH